MVDSGAEDEKKYERKIRVPGDKLFMHQFQTAERILAPDWAEKFLPNQERVFVRPFGTGV